jgi:hypothetical protein
MSLKEAHLGAERSDAFLPKGGRLLKDPRGNVSFEKQYDILRVGPHDIQ